MGGFQDAFILRFTNTGVLAWATYYGGSKNDAGTCITTDPIGNIFVVGNTESADFNSLNLSGAYNDPLWNGGEDMFLLRFSNTGILTWSTFYGGTSNDAATSMNIDFAGNIYVTGKTQSSNFPIFSRTGAYNNPTLNMGIGMSYDVFILRFTSSGSLTWSTFFGGSSDDAQDAGTTIITDPSGNVYVTGQTQSSDFPILTWMGAYNDGILGGSLDVFLIRFNVAGTLTWSTYYGGSDRESIAMVFPYSTKDCVA